LKSEPDPVTAIDYGYGIILVGEEDQGDIGDDMAEGADHEDVRAPKNFKFNSSYVPIADHGTVILRSNQD
jgi:hypothetical protein